MQAQLSYSYCYMCGSYLDGNIDQHCEPEKSESVVYLNKVGLGCVIATMIA